MASEVFFLNDRSASLAESLKFKAVKVFRDAGLGELFSPGDWVGIKIHFGEYGNTACLRPHYVRAIADEIKRCGGKPVVVDCTTILFSDHSSRATATDMLEVGRRHGLTEESLGCPLWVCDGEYGFDDVKVEVPNGVFLKHSYMGKKLQELGAMIAVSHFKGHPLGVFGGALKNIGIGCGSKRGKLLTHCLNHPAYGVKNWTLNQQAAQAAAAGPHPNVLDRLMANCPFDVFTWENETLSMDLGKCIQCAACFGPGLFSGILAPPPELMLQFAATIPDAFSAYVHAIGKDHVGYVSYAVDITPWCDCTDFSRPGGGAQSRRHGLQGPGCHRYGLPGDDGKSRRHTGLHGRPARLWRAGHRAIYQCLGHGPGEPVGPDQLGHPQRAGHVRVRVGQLRSGGRGGILSPALYAG